jgi:hypothetical protein
MQMLSGRGSTTGCFNRPGPIVAAGVQVADVQPQSLDHACTSPLGCTHGLSSSSASDPAPSNSVQLPSCEMDAGIIDLVSVVWDNYFGFHMITDL